MKPAASGNNLFTDKDSLIQSYVSHTTIWSQMLLHVPSSLVELQRGSAFETLPIYWSCWMWIWGPFYGTRVFWIGWFGFHLDLCKEVVGDNIWIFHSTLHQQAFWVNGFMGFSRKKPLSLCPLHQLSTKSTSLETRPVPLSSPRWSLGNWEYCKPLSPIPQSPA